MVGYHLWFIPCIIMVQFYFIVLYHIFMKSITSKIVMFIIFLLSIFFIRNDKGYVAPYSCDIACFACSFFILGNIVNQKNDEINNFGKHGSLQFLNNTLYGALILFIFYLIVLWVMNHFFDVEFHFANNYYTNPICFLLLSLIGIWAISVLSKFVDIGILNGLGKNSLIAFAFNRKAFAICSLVLPGTLRLHTYIYSILLCVLESFILLLFAWAINKFCPFIIGRSKAH